MIDGRRRKILGGIALSELQAVNKRESIELANRFFGAEFLRGQFTFLWRKKKHLPSMVFLLTLVTAALYGNVFYDTNISFQSHARLRLVYCEHYSKPTLT